MSQGSVDAQTIEQTKQQIRGLVQQIAQLSRSDIDAEQFYAEVLHKIVTALAAQGGAVWTMTPDKRLKLDYQINLDRGLLDTQSESAQKAPAFASARHPVGRCKIIASHVRGRRTGFSGQSYQCPARFGANANGRFSGRCLGDFPKRPIHSRPVSKAYLRFLVQMSQLVGDWLKNRKLRTFSDRQSLLGRDRSFCQRSS